MNPSSLTDLFSLIETAEGERESLCGDRIAARHQGARANDREHHAHPPYALLPRPWMTRFQAATLL